MSNPNAQIYGSANFYDQSENGGVVSNAIFHDNALNSGVVTLSGVFNDAATNDGTILSTAIFTGISTNNGIVRKIAIFTDSAVNSETAVIQGNANFSSGTVNNGVLQGTNSGAGGLVDHAYHQGSYWSNAATLELGDTVYLYRYENVKASNVTISSPGLTAEVNSQGIVTSITRIDHPERHSIYWSDDAVLSVGSSLYPSRYTNTLAGSGNFTAAGYIFTFVNGLVTQIQAAGLLGWYEDTSNAHHAVTLNGSVTQNDEGGGVKAARFDNIGSLTFDATALDLSNTTDDIAIEFFAKLDASQDSIFLRNAAGLFILPSAYHGNVLDVGDGTGLELYSQSNVFTYGSYQHFRVVRSSGVTKVFVNGVKVTESSTFDWSHGYDNSITYVLGGTAGGVPGLVGNIAAFRAVIGSDLGSGDGFAVPTTLPTAVSGTQLLLNFGATAVPHVAHWYDDASDAAHAVTLNGSVTQSDEGGGVKAALFDGGSSFKITPDSNLDISASDFTIETWLKVISYDAANSATLIAKDVVAYQYRGSYVIGAEGDNKIGFSASSTDAWGAPDFNILTNSSFSFNTWNHIAVTREISTNTIRLFLNGILEAEQALPFAMQDFGRALTLGRAERDYPNSMLNGDLAGLRIVKGSALYTSNFSVPTTLPTAVSGTQLLLNFGATAVPTVVLNDIFTDVSIDGSYNITPYSYTTHAGRFYVDGVPFTGTHQVTDYVIEYDGYSTITGYHTTTRDILFIVGTEVNLGSVPSVSYTDGVYTITGDVDVSSRGLTSLHFADCVVTGNFNCSSNQLTSLQGAPSTIGFDFNCNNNLLTSLQYAPSTVGRDFNCNNNLLTSLQYAPSTVGRDFNCNNNLLTSLQGAPSGVGENFNCSSNQLTSLRYAPSSVGGNFNCSSNQLTSLRYAPSSVVFDFYCNNNLLTSLQYAPSSVGGNFYCSSNQLTDLQYAPSSVVFDFNCNNNLLTSLQYAPSTVGGNFNCSSNQLTDLQYAPSSVVFDFNCNNNLLTSLQGAPSSVGGNFYCSSNQLTSLQGAPSTIGFDFNCNNNLLTSLQYAPSTVGGNFNCSSNQLTDLQYAPSSVGGNFAFYGNRFSFPIISTDVANVYWEYYGSNYRKHATNHHYVHGSYYADVAVLVSGTTVLYTASDSNTVVANVTFNTTTNTITTNGSGVVTISDLWFKDTSAAQHTITLNGSVTQSDEGSGVKAALFDGSTGYLSLDPQSGFVLDGAFAFDGFFNFETLNGEHIIVLDDYITGFVVRPVNSVLQVFFANTSHVIECGFVTNQTYYLAISREANGDVSVFVNASLMGTFNDSSFLTCNTNLTVGVDTWSFTEHYAGKMYNVRLIKDSTLDGSIPTQLPTAVSGTQLLLNFGATNAPTV